MRGHVQKRGSTYSIVVYLGRDPVTNKKKQKWYSGFKTKKEAEKKLNEVIHQLETGQYVETQNIVLGKYLDDWLNTYVKHNIADNTYLFYSNIIGKVLKPNLGSIQLSKLKPLHIQSFLSNFLEKGTLSTTTVRHYYNVLNIALNQAVKWMLLQNNPCISVEPPKPSKAKIGVLTPEQVDILLEYTKKSEFEVAYVPIVLALTCGMRRGEILGLQWNDVDFNMGVLRISNNLIKAGKEIILSDPKTHLSARTIALLPTVITILKQHRKDQMANRLLHGEKYIENNFVCTWPDGRPIRPDYVTHTIKKLLKRCNLPDIRFHDLRHTHATLLLLKGVNAKVVSERLGHSKIGMTLDTYSHVLPEMQQEAVKKLEETLFSAFH